MARQKVKIEPTGLSKKEKLKRGARVGSYGLAGSITGSLVGVATGVNPKYAHRAGSAAGLIVGGHMETRRNKQVPKGEPRTDFKNYKRRVGTKTNARVGDKDNPYMS